MAAYKAFFVNQERHIEQREDFEARDDEAALEHAKQWAGDLTVEVWSHGIFVGTVRPVSQRKEIRPSRVAPRW